MFATSSSSSVWDLRYFSCISCTSDISTIIRQRRAPGPAQHAWAAKAHLVLLLPLVALLLEPLHAPLEFLRLDVHLPQPAGIASC